MNGERLNASNDKTKTSTVQKWPRQIHVCEEIWARKCFKSRRGLFSLHVLIVVGMFCSGESPASRATLVYNRGFWCGPGWFLLPSNSAPAHTWRTPYNLIELLFGDTFWWCRCGCLIDPAVLHQLVPPPQQPV